MRRLAQKNGMATQGDPGLLFLRTSERGAIERQTSSLLEAFLTAARQGDTEALALLLHNDVRAYNDGGGRTRAARRVLLGVSNVARFVIGVAALHKDRRTARLVTVNGTPGAIVTLSGIPHILSIHIRGGLIYRLFDVCNPDKQRSAATAR